MARIRTIKPEFFASMSRKRFTIGARWLMAGLLCHADDSGRLLRSSRMVSGNVFPFDDDITETQVSKWLDELLRDGIVRSYVVGGAEYLVIPKFNVHQKISHPTPSRLPAPPDGDAVDQHDRQGVRAVGPSPELPLLPASPHQNVTSSAPESLQKYSGETPEPLRKDLGIDLGIELELKGKPPDQSPPPSGLQPTKPPQAPTEVLPPRPHRAHYDKNGTIPLNGAGRGFQENPVDFPGSPEALLAMHPELGGLFPQLDGKPGSGRPSLIDAVRAHWSYYLTVRNRYGGGHANALAQLKLDLGKDARTHHFGWEKDGSNSPTAKSKPKILHTVLYQECLVVAEKYGASCPPDPTQDKNEWIDWCNRNQNVTKEARRRLNEQGAA